MSRSWLLFLGDMREAAHKVVRYVGGRNEQAFFADEMAVDATLRNLEILGEAVKGIPQTVRDAHPEVNWRGIVGLRDILAHAYFAVDRATVWDIIRNKIPQLVDQLDRIEQR